MVELASIPLLMLLLALPQEPPEERRGDGITSNSRTEGEPSKRPETERPARPPEKREDVKKEDVKKEDALKKEVDGGAQLLVDESLREIEESLIGEIGSMEKRLRSIKDRLKGLFPELRWKWQELDLDGGREWDDLPLSPGKASKLRKGPESPGLLSRTPATDPSDTLSLAADEERYFVLVKQEAELEKRIRDLNSSRQAEKKKGEKQRPQEERGIEEARATLEKVLFEMLELREKARERQLKRLRLELETVEGIMEARRDPAARRRMVEARLREVEKGSKP